MPPGSFAHALEGAEQMPMLGGHNFLLISDTEDFKQAGDEDVEALARLPGTPLALLHGGFSGHGAGPAAALHHVARKKSAGGGVALAGPPGGRGLGGALSSNTRAWKSRASLAEEIAGKFEISQDSRSAAGPSAVNLLWMRTELEKLLTARPGMKRVESADLEVIVAFREEREIGKLLRAIGERKCAVALATLRELLASKVAETLILWCIGDLFRQALRGVSSYGNRGGWSRGRQPLFDLGNCAADAEELSARGIAAGHARRAPRGSGDQVFVEGFQNPVGVSGLANCGG